VRRGLGHAYRDRARAALGCAHALKDALAGREADDQAPGVVADAHREAVGGAVADARGDAGELYLEGSAAVGDRAVDRLHIGDGEPLARERQAGRDGAAALVEADALQPQRADRRAFERVDRNRLDEVAGVRVVDRDLAVDAVDGVDAPAAGRPADAGRRADRRHVPGLGAV